MSSDSFKEYYLKNYSLKNHVSLFWLNDWSTFDGYLMPNPVCTYIISKWIVFR